MPTTVNIGSISIDIYVIMILIGAVGMFICMMFRRRRFELNGFHCAVITVILTVCGVAGAMLLHYIENGFQGGGFSFYGSVFLIPIVMPLFGKFFKLRVFETLDLVAPCIAVMVAFIRIACFMKGCCGGWVVYIGDVYFAWPTQIMECIGDFIIFAWLLRVEANENWQGALCPLFMLSYSIMRFFLEFLRYVPDRWFGLGHGQCFAILSIVISVFWLTKYRKQTRKV